MPSVLHVLPHQGGGAERYIELLRPMDGYVQDRAWLSAGRTPLAGVSTIPVRLPAIARSARLHDLIHLHGDVAAMLSVSIARRRPAVVSTHGLSFLRRARAIPLELARSRWRSVASAAQCVICSSDREREELLPITPVHARSRLTVIANAIPLPPAASEAERAAARASLGIDADVTVCLFLGLLDRYKDPLTAVHAAEIARGRGARVELLVAGDGPLSRQVRKHAGPAVRVLGFTAPDPLLSASDVLVMPSLREGSSYALLEAMGHGLAIVASDGAGIPEVVGEAGVIAPVGDAEAFAAALCELASSPAQRDRLGAAARARIAERFDVDRFVAAVATVYAAALADSPGGEPRLAGLPA